MTSQPIVAFKNVVKRFGSFVAVEKMDLEIGRGEFLAIMGSSGCGKTTTLRMLAGLEDPSEGDIFLDGEKVNGRPTWERDTPMVWQSLALFPFLTVQENVEFSLKMRGVGKAERQKRARKWLDRLDILEFADRNVSHLSGGQRQRVALARSLVTEPKILLLDEPLSALDAHLKVRMQAVLSNLQKDLGITFVYVTHSMSEAFSMADRVVIMSRGKVEQIGSPREIYRAPHNRFVAEFLGAANIFSGKVVQKSDSALTVETPHGKFTIEPSEQKPLTKGDNVIFTVGAEHVSLSAEPKKAGKNAVKATVIGEEFVGASATIFLDLGNDIEIQAQKAHDELQGLDLRAGSVLYASWDASSCHILPGE